MQIAHTNGRNTIGALAMMLLIAAAPASYGAITTERASTAFSSTVDQIEGDVVPTTLTDWSDVGSAFITAGGGNLTMTTPNSSFPAIKHNEADDDFSATLGWTWETRFVIDSANDANTGVWEVFVRDNDPALAATRIHFLAGGVSRDVFGAGGGPEIAVDLTDGFHVVRAAVEGGTNLTTVWIDGVKVIDALVSANFDASEFSRIGRWATPAQGGVATIDYIRFDTTGAYAPVTAVEASVPAPAALPAGLALIGLTLARRRR